MTQNIPAETLSTFRPVAVLDRAALSYAVALAALPVERRNTIPVLSNLRLVGTGEALKITGTDCDTWITVTLPGAADSRLAFTVPAAMVSDILKKGKASELASLDHDGGKAGDMAALDLGGVKFKFQTIPAEDFPDAETPSGAMFHLPAAEFLEALDRTRFAMSTEETRYYLNGVYFHARRAERGGAVTLRAVATDGHRLAYFDTSTAVDGRKLRKLGGRFKGAGGHAGFILPRRAAELTLKAAAAMRKAKALPEVIRFTVDRRLIRLDFGAVQITAKLVDGTFPDYLRVVPRHNPNVARFGVKAMAEAVTQVSLISQEKGRAVRFSFAAGAVALLVNNPDAGTAESAVPCTLDGKETEIGFNSRYVLDVLAEIGGDDVIIRMDDSGTPAVFNDPDDSRFAAVLMPMRV